MTQQVLTLSLCFPKIGSADLNRLIFSFMPFESLLALPSVSRAFQAQQEQWMEQEWGKLAKNPLFNKRFENIDTTLSFAKRFVLLFEMYKKITERTAAGFNAFHGIAREKINPDLAKRFEQTEQATLSVENDLDDNLAKFWVEFTLQQRSGGRSDFDAVPRLALHGPLCMNATDIRTLIHDIPRASFDAVRGLTLDVPLSALPPELAHCGKLRDLRVNVTRMREIPEWFEQLSELEKFDLKVDSGIKPLLDHVPPALLRLPNLLQGGWRKGVDCSGLPIHTLTEEVYDHCFTWEHWLGRPFDWRYFPYRLFRIFFWCQDWYQIRDFFQCFAYLLGWHENCSWYGRGYIEIYKKELQQIPFALWLREQLQIPNLFMYLIGLVDQMKWLDRLLRDLLKMPLWLGFFVFGVFIWPINRFLSLIVVPIVTKIRELFGWGRMIRINSEE